MINNSALRARFSSIFLCLLVFFCAQNLHAQATWSPIVKVGPGYVDCYTRQVVRTSGDVVYVVTNASGFSGGTIPSSIRMYKGSPSGNPTSFAEVDAAHRPANGTRFGGVEAKLAGTDRFIQIVYEDIAASQTKYVKFDTVTDTWGTPETISALNGQNTLNRYMGKTGLALDANGLPHVVTGGTNEAMYYANRTAGTWSTPVAVAPSSADMHPSLAFDGGGTLHMAFYDNAAGMFYRQRNPTTGVWSATETVTSNASTSQSDESPSLAIDSTGRVLVDYIAGDFSFHYQLALRTAANTWSNISPTAAVAGHGPGLYIDPADNIYALEGHDVTVIQPSVEIRSAAGTWGAYSILASGPPTRDGSASARWDLLWPGNTAHLDFVNMDEAGVDPATNGTTGVTYYLHAALGGAPPPPPASDFSLSLPSGSTVTIAAGQSATSNLSVAASGGFNQAVTLSCSGAPTGAACNISPASINPNGSTAAAQVSITTTARGSLFWPGKDQFLWLAPLLVMVAGWILLLARKPMRRPVWMAVPVLASVLLVIVACSGGAGMQPSPTPAPTPNPSPSPTPAGGGTPAGTYALTITGTSGNTTHHTTMTLTVN
ncbi:MAG TPA: hypothetical protein VLN58_11085 [Verrucomicrobiae bacterium]|nr:hypothetical protein [Verrucomicrobiae bacterium]